MLVDRHTKDGRLYFFPPKKRSNMDGCHSEIGITRSREDGRMEETEAGAFCRNVGDFSMIFNC